MNLEKKIVYINYYENYERIKNVGHIKILIRDGNCILDLQIKGLHETDTLMAEMKGVNEEISIGRICIDKGAAYFNSTFPMDNMDGQGNGFGDLMGIKIKLSDSRYLEGRWEEEKPRKRIENKVKEEIKEEVKEEVQNIKAEKDDSDIILKFVEPIEEKQVSAAEHSVNGGKNLMYDDKWVQLCHSYPTVHPFVNQEYISIKPKDFTILRREYQQLVNNSFLLHGFYNYRHIILGKSEKKGKEVYLLGVPGTYFEREKMAAIMFGFESFEVSEQEFSEETIQEGTFGYYLRTVDI